MRRAIKVPGDAAGVVKRVAEVWAAWLDRNGEPDLPDGWAQFYVDERGRPVYGYTGRSWSPRREDLEALAEALRRRN